MGVEALSIVGGESAALASYCPDTRRQLSRRMTGEGSEAREGSQLDVSTFAGQLNTLLDGQIRSRHLLHCVRDEELAPVLECLGDRVMLLGADVTRRQNGGRPGNKVEDLSCLSQ